MGASPDVRATAELRFSCGILKRKRLRTGSTSPVAGWVAEGPKQITRDTHQCLASHLRFTSAWCAHVCGCDLNGANSLIPCTLRTVNLGSPAPSLGEVI